MFFSGNRYVVEILASLTLTSLLKLRTVASDTEKPNDLENLRTSTLHLSILADGRFRCLIVVMSLTRVPFPPLAPRAPSARLLQL